MTDNSVTSADLLRLSSPKGSLECDSDWLIRNEALR